MEETLLDKGILKKTDKRRKEFSFLHNHAQSWNAKQAITLKHLITYINLKDMINMHVTDDHVWGHAYEHDKTFKLKPIRIKR
jgi:hypothetical protein